MDASVGLTFSLRLFQRYRRNGILQAKIRHIPGIQGACIAYIQMTAGSVTACYLENKQGQRLPFSIDDLCRLDQERGPFEWVFQQQAAPARSHPTAAPSMPAEQPLTSPPAASPAQDAISIPKVIAQPRWEQFNHWTLEQKLLLQDVWQNIDGKRSIRDIKANLPYAPQVVDDLIQILLTLRLIVLVS